MNSHAAVSFFLALALSTTVDAGDWKDLSLAYCFTNPSPVINMSSRSVRAQLRWARLE